MKKPSPSGTRTFTVLTLLLLVGVGTTVVLSVAACDGTSTKTTDTPPTPTSTPDGSQAETPVTYPTAAASFPAQRGSADVGEGSFGWTFTPTVDIEVTHLGYFDDSGDGLLNPHPVAIFDTATKQLLVEATVQRDSPLDKTHRYAEIVPVILKAGQTYIVVTYAGPPFDPEVNRPYDLTWAPETGNADLGYRVEYYHTEGATELVYPSEHAPYLFMTPNFKFRPVAAK